MKIFILLVMIFLYSDYCSGQNKTVIKDSINKPGFSAQKVIDDTLQTNQNAPVKTYRSVVTKLLQQNYLLQFLDNSSLLLHHQKKSAGKEFLFYILSVIILLLGIFKSFYAGYFNNVFKVFFNTSLRQNQLTDILLQARLPSLLFNIFFIIISGFYLWLVLIYYQLLKPDNNKILLALIVALIGLIYFCKFLSLKFIGWISGMKEITDTYIFVTFLINKIAGIILIPFMILLAFSQSSWGNIIVLFSFLIMIVLFLLRFFRSYGLVENKLSVSHFHFFIYIIAIEIIPVFLIYKIVMKTLV